MCHSALSLIFRVSLLLCVIQLTQLTAKAQCGGDSSSGPSEARFPQHGRFGCPHELAVYIHTGRVFPHGDLGNQVGSSYGMTAGLIYTLTPTLSLDLQAGRSWFPGNKGKPSISIENYSANVAFAVLHTRPWVFINGGPGAYRISAQGLKYGFNVGGGLGYPLAPFIILEVTYNYRSTVGATPNIAFSSLQGGFIFKIRRR